LIVLNRRSTPGPSLALAPAPAKNTRNRQASRARILAAARAEFVARGLNGARVDRIAAQARLNKNLIYHYFESKERLYLAVLESIYGEMRASQRDEEVRRLTPLEGMRRLVENTFDHFVATPDLIRLMSIENIHFARHLKTSSVIKPLFSPLLATIKTLLADGQRAGVFRTGVDAIDLYLSISGLAYFYLSNQHTLSWLLDRNLVAPARLKRRRAHVVEVVESYLRPQPQKPWVQEELACASRPKAPRTILKA
jgi:TetR/AcrR family transcriptional regulator